MNTVLHVPLNKELKLRAETKAKIKGYSSLQEVLRVFIVQFSEGKIEPEFMRTDLVVRLTDEQEAILNKRFNQVEREIENGTAYSAQTVEEMMDILDN